MGRVWQPLPTSLNIALQGPPASETEARSPSLFYKVLQ